MQISVFANFLPQMLKLSDKDFEKLGLTAGARKKLRVNLEVLRYVENLSVCLITGV